MENNSKSIKNGRIPLSQKPAPARGFGLDAIFGDRTALGDDAKALLRQKGLSWRWINRTKFVEMGGYHDRGWRPIKAADLPCDSMKALDGILGANPDGYVQRGDMVLAVRSTDLNEKHKAYLEQESRARSMAASSKAHAKELSRHIRQSGLEAKILEGYEDENEK